MLKELIEKITNLQTANIFDPAVFNDPVALQTAWTPAASGGANFATHKLHIVHPQRVEFRCSVAMKLMSGIFLGVGLVVIGVFAQKLIGKDVAFESALLMPLGFGLIFALVGGFLLRNALTPTVFDLNHGYFCKSRQKPEQTMDPSRIKHYAQLCDVHALQLISERCSSKNGSYFSYELNLVLNDGTRINVVDHGNLGELKRDALLIAELIQKPLWDAC